MKDSKEKEHRISNLKNMISNVNDDDEIESFEEDSELIDYLNKDSINYDNLEIDDEFIYRPGEETENAINLEENKIDENFLIKTPKEEDLEDDNELNDEFKDDIASEISENFDNVINSKIGGRPFLGVISTILGSILVILSIFILDSRSDRVIDNVASGETTFIFIIFLIVGLLLLIYGVYKVFNIRNPFGSISNEINSIDNKTDDDATETKKEKPSPKALPKSDIPLDKESYKVGEFDMGELKDSLKKPTASKNKKSDEEIPLATQKPAKKGSSNKEIDDDYIEVKHDTESIDEIFAEVEDIDDIPIISIDSEEDNK